MKTKNNQTKGEKMSKENEINNKSVSLSACCGMREGLLMALTLALGLAATTPAMADSCANGAGATVTGKDEKVYCRSKISMNWWSAFSWCESAGYTLADATVDCACTNSTCSGFSFGSKEDVCMNLSGSISVPSYSNHQEVSSTYWTRNVYAQNNQIALAINNLGYGNTPTVHTQYKISTLSPLCRM